MVIFGVKSSQKGSSELNLEDFISRRHTKDEINYSFNLFSHWSVLILFLRKTKAREKKFSSTQAVAPC